MELVALLTTQLLLQVSWPTQLALGPRGTVAFIVKKADVEANRSKTSLWLWEPASSEAPRAVYDREGGVSSPSFSPDGQRLAFIGAEGGRSAVFVLPVERAGEAQRVTRLSTGAGGPLVWSRDGTQLAFTSEVYPGCGDDRCNEEKITAREKSKVRARVYDGLLFRHWNAWRGQRRSHVFVTSLNGAALRDLTPGPHDAPPLALGGERDVAFSTDGQRVYYVKNTDDVVATSTNNDVFEVGVDGTGERRLSSGLGNDHSPRPSPDGKRLAYLSMARAGYEADRLRLIVRDLSSGSETEWGKGLHQPQSLEWTPDGRGLLFISPHRGRQEIFLVREGGEVVQLTRGAYAKHLAVSPAGLAYTDEAVHRAPGLAFLAATKDGFATLPKRAVLSFEGGAAPRLSPAEHHFFEGAHGDRVHGILVKPPLFEPNRKYPAVVIIHGGPQGQTGDEFHPRWNLSAFAALGYVVFGINFHGSTGFGQKFTDAIRADWNGGPYVDVQKGTEYLASLPFVDGARICAAGASYGGYLVNWIASHSTRYRCLVSHAGLYQLEAKYGSTEELWFPEWEFKGTPWTARERYRAFSPASYVEHLRTPTLVVHGAKDYRVPLSQGLGMFTALQRQRVPSRLLVFPDEDHFVQKPQNIQLWWKTVGDWLARWLSKGD